MSLTLSRADLSGSRDEALSSVHNQWFEAVTRSTTDIAASSTTNTLIDQSSDPLLSSTAPGFTGANIGSISGCTFQIFHGNVKIVQNERKLRIVIKSDEDDWLWSYFLSTLSSFELIFTASIDTDLTYNQENIVWSTKNPFSNFRINNCLCKIPLESVFEVLFKLILDDFRFNKFVFRTRGSLLLSELLASSRIRHEFYYQKQSAI